MHHETSLINFIWLLHQDKQKRMFSDHYAKLKLQAEAEKVERKKRKFDSCYNDFTSPVPTSKTKKVAHSNTSNAESDSSDSRDKDSTMWEATTGAMNEISLHFQQKRLHEHVSSTTDAQLPIKERVELLKFLMTFVSEEKKKECIDELCALAGL